MSRSSSIDLKMICCWPACSQEAASWAVNSHTQHLRHHPWLSHCLADAAAFCCSSTNPKNQVFLFCSAHIYADMWSEPSNIITSLQREEAHDGAAFCECLWSSQDPSAHILQSSWEEIDRWPSFHLPRFQLNLAVPKLTQPPLTGRRWGWFSPTMILFPLTVAAKAIETLFIYRICTFNIFQSERLSGTGYIQRIYCFVCVGWVSTSSSWRLCCL